MAKQVHMPRLTQTMTEGRVARWLKNEGDAVQKGEALVVVESDKAEVEVEADVSGVLGRILVAEGMDADVDAPLAIIVEPGEDPVGSEGRMTSTIPEAPPVPGSAQPAAAPSPLAPQTSGRRAVSPVARRVAQELGVDLSQVPGTGVNGLVTEKDVRAFAERRTAVAGIAGSTSVATSPSDDEVEIVPFTAIRRRIAERMALSRRTAADVTTVTDVDMTEVSRLRQRKKISYTAYVAWAAAQALREFPILNASVDEDKIILKKNVHLGIAVALDHGLIVPVIRHADRKSVEEIAREIDDLAERGRAGRLNAEELTGSTFTITNSGAFGSLLFTPIINYPEVGILGMGKVVDTPVVRNGEIVVGKVMYLCLTYDHRVVDGAPAVQFLQATKRRLETPEA